MNENWTWESSPRRQFNLRKLEKCYLMDSKVQIKRGVRTETITKKLKKMGKKSSQLQTEPYWNIWRAVLTGWLIRYPGVFFRATMLGVLSFILLILIIISPSEGPERPSETPREPLLEEIK